MKYFLFVTVISAFLLSACAQATPTVDPAMIQASAIAQANTIVAQTQAAIPTNTATPEVSPTPLDTPTPTFDTSVSQLPTLGSLASPTIASSTGTVNCVKALDMGAAGRKHDTLIKNESSGTFNISLNLYKPNQFGECGAISFANIGKNGTVDVGLPSGYWFAYAWGTKGKSEGYFYVQPAMFDKVELCVRDASLIVYKPSC